ncbi:hypothetical protein CXP39_03150 [Mesoplasma syrphidae]|uniref:Uncharacterized protein n=1 Tax=Mesoplasma syrphidae TaxID=225999 RepID=A0A2K9BS04_9MOLU|nr:hypothetical protein [Mesoplasma syrphidae]AUF83782.1 hypothetical protein CXP39_03150 [Mesoplasma syrphidae]
MTNFYSLITELFLLLALVLFVISSFYLGVNFIKFWLAKDDKEFSWPFLCLTIGFGIFIIVAIIKGSIWTYSPTFFGYDITNEYTVKKQIVWSLIAFSLELLFIGYILFFDKYFFCIVNGNQEPRICGSKPLKKSKRYFFKKTKIAQKMASLNKIKNK